MQQQAIAWFTGAHETAGLFGDTERHNGKRRYLPILTAVENEKGVLDVDTVKGCALGMRAHPEGGCYGECYANKTAARYGIDFAVSVSRKLTPATRVSVFCTVRDHPSYWYRIGTAGEPCHDWDNTLEVCEYLQATGKTPIIITKHWIPLSDNHIRRLSALVAVVNTSVSGFDTDAQIKHRIAQMERLKAGGVRSITRVVTCEYGTSEWARAAKKKQDYLLTLAPVIDNPLRAEKTNPHVLNGDIILTKRQEAIGGGKLRQYVLSESEANRPSGYDKWIVWLRYMTENFSSMLDSNQSRFGRSRCRPPISLRAISFMPSKRLAIR